MISTAFLKIICGIHGKIGTRKYTHGTGITGFTVDWAKVSYKKQGRVTKSSYSLTGQ